MEQQTAIVGKSSTSQSRKHHNTMQGSMQYDTQPHQAQAHTSMRVLYVSSQLNSNQTISSLKDCIHLRIYSLNSVYVSDIAQEKWKKRSQTESAGVKAFLGVAQTY